MVFDSVRVDFKISDPYLKSIISDIKEKSVKEILNIMLSVNKQIFNMLYDKVKCEKERKIFPVFNRLSVDDFGILYLALVSILNSKLNKNTIEIMKEDE